MPSYYGEPSQIRIPARVGEGGRLSFFYGGSMPALKPGSFVEVVVAIPDDIESTHHREALEQEQVREMFPAGTCLLVPIGDAYPDRVAADLTCKNPQALPQLWIAESKIRGVFAYLGSPLNVTISVGHMSPLHGCLCWIPALHANVGSLNQAYTLISEEYEPKRRSHTGNVFEKVFYAKEATKEWLELKYRRLELLSNLGVELLREFSPWWRSSVFRHGGGEWAYLDAPGDATVRIHVLTSCSAIVERVDFDRRQEAIYWLEENRFAHYGEEDFSDNAAPPPPPYLTLLGERVELV